MEKIERYKHFNSFLKNKFGERVLKICINGGFTCPNRDGTKGCGGCIFCSSKGSGEHIKYNNIQEQIEQHLASYRGERANKFIAYFQNFSNTYASTLELKQKYDIAISNPQIVALSVATRPDCLDEEKVKLLSSYNKRLYTYIELGLQTSNDKTGEIINRCFTTQEFENAVKLLNKYNIDVVVHIMVGLPNETRKDLEQTIKFLKHINYQGIKIHSTYILKNTKLEKMYQSSEYSPISLDEYIDDVIYILEHINKDIIIHRMSGDAPKDLLVAPEYNLHKKWIINGIEKELEKRNVFQGSKYNKIEE